MKQRQTEVRVFFIICVLSTPLSVRRGGISFEAKDRHSGAMPVDQAQVYDASSRNLPRQKGLNQRGVLKQATASIPVIAVTQASRAVINALDAVMHGWTLGRAEAGWAERILPVSNDRGKKRSSRDALEE
jgi:hypothetical protein